MDTAAILNIVLTANTTQASAAMARTQAQLSATQKKAAASSAMIGKAFLGIGIAAGAAGVALFKLGEEFDSTYDKIRTQTGATGKEMMKLKRSFRDVVSDVPADFETAGKAVGELNTRLGLSGKPLNRMAKQMTELSRITETDVSTNIESVSKAFVDWEVAVKDQTKTLDGFFRLSQKSGMSVADIAANIQKFGSPLRQLGFDIDEAAAMFASFERAGVNIQTMVPGLKLAISNLTRPTETLAASMADLGIKAGDPEKALTQVFDILGDKNRSQVEKTGLAMDVFGKRAGADMAEAVSQGRFELDKFLKIMRDGDGTIRETGRKTMDLSEHFQVFANNLKLTLEPIAKDVFKGLSNLMKEVTAAFKKGGVESVIDLLVQKFEDAIPKITEVAGKIGGALVKGIVSSPEIVAFLTGAFILKSGLASIGRAAGVAIGSPMGLAIAATAASAFAGAKLSDKILADKDSFLPMNASEGVVHLAEALDITTEHAQRLANFMGNHPGFDTTASLKMMREQAQHTKNSIKDLGNTWGLTANEIRQKTRQNFKAIRQTMGTESMEAKIAVMNNFEAAKDAIRNSMDAGLISARRGAKMIHDVLIKQLKGYGIKDPEGFINRQEQASEAHQHGGVSGLATGGLAAMVPGRSTGDKHTLSIDGVPKAKVESGEGVFVGNRKLMGAAAVANAAIPRFATGGGLDFALGPETIPPIQYDPNHAGGNSHLHVTGTSTPWIVGIGHKLQQMGWMVGEHPAFGGVSAVHSATGGHYDALAIDANTSADETHAELAAAARILGGAGGVGAAAALAKLNLPRFGSDFGLGLMVAQGLNNASAGIEEVIGRAAAAKVGSVTGGVSVPGGAYSGPLDRDFGRGSSQTISEQQAAFLAEKAGLPGTTYGQIAIGESGLRPGAVSTDGGYGLWQMTPRVQSASTVSAWENIGSYFNPWNNALMAKVLAGSGTGTSNYFGTSSVTDWNAHYTGPSFQKQRGGLLAMLAEGGSIPELFPQLGSADQETRKDTQARILEKIAKFGMHPDTLTRLFQGTNALAEHQEYASLAAAGDITDANDNLIPGLFRSGTEHSWLLKAREEAWTLRENLIKADTAMKPQIEAFESKDGLIKKAEKRLEQVRDALHKAQEDLKGFLKKIEEQRDIIEKAREKLALTGNQELSNSEKKKQQDKIDAAQKVIENITGEKIPRVESDIDRATRERDALVEPVIPALAAKFEELRAIKDGIRGDSYSDELTGMGFDGLKTIQGTGSSMDLFPMPDDLHQRFGGTLNDIQQQLLAMIPAAKPGDTVIDQLEAALALAGLTADLSDDISAQSQIVTYWEEELARLQASGAPASEIGSAANSLSSAKDALAGLQETTSGSDTDSLKLEALMAENARLRMSAQQAGTFAGFFKQFSAMPQFATGGVMSQTGPALVHGREGIFTPEQMAALGGRGDVNVNVNLDGMDVVVETWIDGVLAKETRKALSRGPTVGRRTS